MDSLNKAIPNNGFIKKEPKSNENVKNPSWGEVERDWEERLHLIKRDKFYAADYNNTTIWMDDVESSEEEVETKPVIEAKTVQTPELNLQPEAQKRSQNVDNPIKIEVDKEDASELVSDRELMSNHKIYSANEQNEDEVTPCSTSDCIHAKQNDLLMSALNELNNRNTLLEDFIQVEYGEKFEKFVKRRQHIIKMGYGERERETSGKRSAKADEVVELLKLTKGAAPFSSSSTKHSDTLETVSKKSNRSHKRKRNSGKPDVVTIDLGDNPEQQSSFNTTPTCSKTSLSSSKKADESKMNPKQSSSDAESSGDDVIDGKIPQTSQGRDRIRTRKICPICKATIRMRYMRDHLLITHKNKKLNCAVENCKRTFRNRLLYKRHLIDKHLWSEDNFLAIMKSVEEPVIDWLNEQLSKVRTANEIIGRMKKTELKTDKCLSGSSFILK